MIFASPALGGSYLAAIAIAKIVTGPYLDSGGRSHTAALLWFHSAAFLQFFRRVDEEKYMHPKWYCNGVFFGHLESPDEGSPTKMPHKSRSVRETELRLLEKWRLLYFFYWPVVTLGKHVEQTVVLWGQFCGSQHPHLAGFPRTKHNHRRFVLRSEVSQSSSCLLGILGFSSFIAD